ncbi:MULTISPECIES: hypothetical protein [Aerococcus]|uniref:hypothetical protein n=1 Tax=Aerococcus TaxID=1375 RepID=UPI000200ED64|nr:MULTISPECIES: hypothetical protein [Aerococcus]AEA01734.1 hypothetical protein HMPREF9243_0320 [Aerococcus sp. Group 1]MCY3030742.1 hypothetical protein [Aerococcus sp. Group 1]MCY3055110.1 hypothetical protein [Aerococcus sp. Group 1]MCY3056840.1 hypothetical protein [Aerococcus sp. Group 1]MCY3062300.1 hypothetical protein [Aerococcus sp. Group 1]
MKKQGNTVVRSIWTLCGVAFLALVLGFMSFFYFDYDHIVSEIQAYQVEQNADHRQLVYEENFDTGFDLMEIDIRDHSEIEVIPADSYSIKIWDVKGEDLDNDEIPNDTKFFDVQDDGAFLKINEKILGTGQFRRHPIRIQIAGPDFSQSRLNASGNYADLSLNQALKDLYWEVYDGQVTIKSPSTFPMTFSGEDVAVDMTVEEANAKLSFNHGYSQATINGRSLEIPASQDLDDLATEESTSQPAKPEPFIHQIGEGRDPIHFNGEDNTVSVRYPEN